MCQILAPIHFAEKITFGSLWNRCKKTSLADKAENRGRGGRKKKLLRLGQVLKNVLLSEK
jgi:hypothetical protein